MNKTRFMITVAAAFLLSATVFADNAEQKERSAGYVTGSFETNTNVYQEDLKTNATVPDGKFGSNNYLKVDYYNSKFSAGLQLEAYTPVNVGYPSILEKAALTNYYVGWKDKDFSVTAGTFYEQFGSGLLFRSWEDRALGINNAIMGARVAYNFQDIVTVKAFWGIPRFLMSLKDQGDSPFSQIQTNLKGADLSFSLSNLLGWNSLFLAMEGSVLHRYEKLPVKMEAENLNPNSIGYSARVNAEIDGFYFRGEYVNSGDKYFENPLALDPEYYDEAPFVAKKGNAQLIETGYTRRGLGVSLSLRRLEWMGLKASELFGTDLKDINMMNYVPALSTQYTYMLTNLHPYGAQTGECDLRYTNSGEIGGQLDVFYNFRRGTVLGGKRGMKVHANLSTYYAIAQEGTFKFGNMLFRDISVDVERQWTKEFKSVLMWSMQEYNTSYGANKNTRLQNIVVADLLYKYTPSFSTRLELQYLVTHEDQKDWMAALLEVSFATSWSIYASDMYNHGSTKLHYYNAGVSYSKSRTRVALGYGRFKDGKICSGGVCRTVPAYTGFNLTLTTSF